MNKNLTFVALIAALLTAPVLARGPWRASEDNTGGWHLMSPKERLAHQAQIRSFKSYADCHAYQLAHHQQMQARATAQGATLNPDGRDICAHLRPESASR